MDIFTEQDREMERIDRDAESVPVIGDWPEEHIEDWSERIAKKAKSHVPGHNYGTALWRTPVPADMLCIQAEDGTWT